MVSAGVSPWCQGPEAVRQQCCCPACCLGSPRANSSILHGTALVYSANIPSVPLQCQKEIKSFIFISQIPSAKAQDSLGTWMLSAPTEGECMTEFVTLLLIWQIETILFSISINKILMHPSKKALLPHVIIPLEGKKTRKKESTRLACKPLPPPLPIYLVPQCHYARNIWDFFVMQ